MRNDVKRQELLLYRRTFDLPRPRLLVQPFRVPCFHDLQRRVDVHLHEVQPSLLVQLARGLPVCAVRRDEGGYAYAGRVGEEFRHLRPEDV